MNCKIYLRGLLAQITMLAITLLTTSFNTNAQTYVSVAPSKMNVFYIGVDNPITVAASAAADNKVTVSIAGGGGKITKLKPGMYNVHVTTVTDECLVNVFADGKIVGTSTFRVRPMPAPQPILGWFPSGSKIAADVFKRQVGLATQIENFPFETHFDIVSYTISVDTDKKDVKSADCLSGVFCEQAKQLIEENVKADRIVTFDKIVAKGPDGTTRRLPSLVYFIK
jgi:hypothetical protein